MNPEQFSTQLHAIAQSLGRVQGQLDAIMSQNASQSEALARLDTKIDTVRSSLSSKIDAEIKVVTARADAMDARLRSVEVDNGKRTAGIAAVSGVAVAVIIEAAKGLLKLKG